MPYAREYTAAARRIATTRDLFNRAKQDYLRALSANADLYRSEIAGYMGLPYTAEHDQALIVRLIGHSTLQLNTLLDTIEYLTSGE